MTGHPLAELADDLAETPGPDETVGLAARILRSLHPDVARVALALAEGLTVPDGWTVRMDARGALVVAGNGNALGVTPYSDGTWMAWKPDRPGTYVACKDDAVPTAQAAVDAAVEALGGDPCP